MRWTIRFIAAALAILGLTPFHAVTAADSNAGTSAAQFLKIGAGARPTAMGDAFVGIADDVNAAYFNPAGLSNISRPEITAMHTQWLQNLNYDYGAFVYPTDMGAFALSAYTLEVPDIEERGLDESYVGQFEQQDAAYGLSFARNLTPLLSVGITAKYVRQEIASVSAATLSGDVGVLKRPGRLPLSLGLSVRHIGGKLRFREESDPLPLTVDAGAGLPLLSERLILGLNVRKSRDADAKFGVGGEWRQRLGRDFGCAFRGGYNSATTDAEDATGITMGGGLTFKQFSFDAAWVPFGSLGNTFRYAASARF